MYCKIDIYVIYLYMYECVCTSWGYIYAVTSLGIQPNKLSHTPAKVYTLIDSLRICMHDPCTIILLFSFVIDP